MRVGNLTKKIINGTPPSDPLTYGDINGRQLFVPDFAKQPYRRAIVCMAKAACDNALGSSRSHNCLQHLDLSAERWILTSESIRSESTGFDLTPFAQVLNQLAEV